ncbi:MAG: amino acid ABC transporter substrate-binding protein [Clostridia bacterium]|nr:amino acid ABC transporter substrate-binding protein [Clostridia bacterium]
MKLRAIALALAALMCLGLGAHAEEAAAQYIENEWNFVENAMDVTGGIPEGAEGVLASVREAGVLRVGTEPYFPPQEFIDPALEGQDRYVGADMELARLVAQRMGVELEIIPMEFTHVLDAVSEGECDLVISALAYTPERASRVTLSKGYNYAEAGAGSGLVIRAADAGAIAGLDDLNGRDVIAQSGSLQEALTAQHVTGYREFRRVGSVEACYDAVARGDMDAAICDIESALAYIEGSPDCGLTVVEDARLVLEPQFDGDRVAAKKGELQLMYFVNGVIDELLESGQYRQWFIEYEEYARKLGM